jgi:hypothetical protein
VQVQSIRSSDSEIDSRNDRNLDVDREHVTYRIGAVTFQVSRSPITSERSKVCRNYALLQGDKIGPFFAHWAIFYSGQFFLIYRSSPHMSWGYVLFPRLRILTLTEIRVWLHFGRFFSPTHLVTLHSFGLGGRKNLMLLRFRMKDTNCPKRER